MLPNLLVSKCILDEQKTLSSPPRALFLFEGTYKNIWNGALRIWLAMLVDSICLLKWFSFVINMSLNISFIFPCFPCLYEFYLVFWIQKLTKLEINEQIGEDKFLRAFYTVLWPTNYFKIFSYWFSFFIILNNIQWITTTNTHKQPHNIYI